ncbi:palmitoyltransferase ZDHHC2-like isoform X2 [Varroa destructor]|uniref:Palmitoyltransferase n=1 Tax=Varroa destructor TaxID=109461 RepID=A0A7M7J515_VARDE|nr:palmitoyltransferase ZDHHC2-like isoform X2 [Varroa destructor]
MLRMGVGSIRVVIRSFKKGSWLLQGLGLLKCLPPSLAILYHLAEQLLFCSYFLPTILEDVALTEKLFYFAIFQGSALTTLATAFHLKFKSRPRSNQLVTTNCVCKKCGLPREARTYHCLICNVCVPMFDHHCAWLDFLLLLAMHGVSTAIFLYWNFWRLNIFEIMDLAVFTHFVASLFFGSASLILAFIQLFFVALNQTTMEFLMNKPTQRRSLVHNLQSVFGRSWLHALIPLYEEIRIYRQEAILKYNMNRASLGGRAKSGSVQTSNHQNGYRLSHAHMGTQFNSINL